MIVNLKICISSDSAMVIDKGDVWANNWLSYINNPDQQSRTEKLSHTKMGFQIQFSDLFH